MTADEDMVLGDLQVKWDGGGILRDTTLLWEQIDEIIERNLGASLADITQKSVDHGQASPQAPSNTPPSPEQEVVKQADVSENEEVLAESPEQGDIIAGHSTEAPLVESGPQRDDQTNEQASDKEPVG